MKIDRENLRDSCLMQGPPGRDGGSGVKGGPGLSGLPVSLYICP